MRKINLIEDGNFPRWVRLGLIVIGVLAMCVAVKFIPPSIFGGIVLLAGFGIALVGGYTSRAAMLKIKPFDNSYKKARKSYEVKNDESDES
ncbi:DUF4231 domain-containing protein [Burkholderia sp. BCC0044]|uniref:DUF4231 domain-containing protein n=1 Tax=Burkholderia sp. BCC0044 TaxID=2676295 RepID=UPI001FC8A319|nr:DUF4231 domain-containing protein [Burkholderia sp. BCC0044]